MIDHTVHSLNKSMQGLGSISSKSFFVGLWVGIQRKGSRHCTRRKKDHQIQCLILQIFLPLDLDTTIFGKKHLVCPKQYCHFQCFAPQHLISCNPWKWEWQIFPKLRVLLQSQQISVFLPQNVGSPSTATALRASETGHSPSARVWPSSDFWFCFLCSLGWPEPALAPIKEEKGCLMEGYLPSFQLHSSFWDKVTRVAALNHATSFKETWYFGNDQSLSKYPVVFPSYLHLLPYLFIQVLLWLLVLASSTNKHCSLSFYRN